MTVAGSAVAADSVAMDDCSIPDRILDAALAVAARDGWSAASLAAVAREAGVPLVEIYDRFPARAALAQALLRRIDRAMLAGADDDGVVTPQDRLFDVIMRRIDVLQEHREGYLAVLRSRDAGLIAAAPAAMRSLSWIGEAAGLSTAGWRGALRLQALGAVYLAVLRAWASDDSSDLGATMAALQEGLSRWGRRLGIQSPDDAALQQRD